MDRTEDIDRFYRLMQELKQKHNGFRKLKDCNGYMDWPEYGVYFFFSPDETTESGFPRLTRVGTHAVSQGSSTTLWDRLYNHRGYKDGGGNHRGSVFRKVIGEAIIQKQGLEDKYPHWGEGSSAPSREVSDNETPMEKQVSEYIGQLPMLWIEVNGKPGPDSNRAFIEQNTARLVSNYDKEVVDGRSSEWLGKNHPSEKIRESGLWCQKKGDIRPEYDEEFLEMLEKKNSV